MTIDQLTNWCHLYNFGWQWEEAGVRMYRGEADCEEVFAPGRKPDIHILETAANLMARRYGLVPVRIALAMNHTKE